MEFISDNKSKFFEMNKTTETGHKCSYCKAPALIRTDETGTKVWIPHEDNCQRPRVKVEYE